MTTDLAFDTTPRAVTLTMHYPPSANRYWRVYRNVVVCSDEANAYKLEVTNLCNQRGIEPLAGNLCVSLTVYRPQKSGDLDNRIKVVLDSLQGLAYNNDSQIVEIHAYRQDDKKRPRVEITLTPVEEA